MRAIFPLMLLALLVACKSTGQLKKSNQTSAPIQKQGIVVGGFDSPKSILRTPFYMFVSNMGKDRDVRALDGDGYISRLSLGGEVEMEQFIIDLNAPKGMAEVDGILYVADVTEIKMFEIQSGEPRGSIDFQSYQTTNLVDILPVSSSELLITDPDKNRIYSFDILTQQVDILQTPEGISGVHALDMDPTTQLTAIVSEGQIGMTNGQVAYMYPSDDPNDSMGSVQKLDSPLGQFEGVCFYNKKYIIFADSGGEQQGKIHYHNTETQETWLFNAANVIQSPSDFALDLENRSIWIPDVEADKVIQEYIPFQ